MAVMTNEEILEKSRNENKQKDIVDIEVQMRASMIAILTGVCLSIVIFAVKYFVEGTLCPELIMLVCGMEAVLFTVKYVKLHKLHELFTAIIYAAGFVATLLAWIFRAL